jgi:hypothetical protein
MVTFTKVLSTKDSRTAKESILGPMETSLKVATDKTKKMVLERWSTLIMATISVFEADLGTYSGGQRNGEGLFQYKNKDRYSGEWKNGRKHGKGTYIIDASKVKLIGEWFEGEITKGKWILANGDAYEGHFEHNRPVGDGTWNLKNGTTVNGNYNHEFLENDGKPDDLNPIDPSTGKKIRLSWNTVSSQIKE